MAGFVICHATTPVKRCGRCHIPQYCSNIRQKETHRSSCEPEKETNLDIRIRPGGPDATRPAANASETARRLLNDCPKEETYRRLIDTYRLRAADALLTGGQERGWTYDLRSGGPPKDDFHNFLIKARTQDVLPAWFGQEAHHACIDYALNPDGDSFTGHSIDAENVEEDYNDASTPTTHMRGGSRPRLRAGTPIRRPRLRRRGCWNSWCDPGVAEDAARSAGCATLAAEAGCGEKKEGVRSSTIPTTRRRRTRSTTAGATSTLCRTGCLGVSVWSCWGNTGSIPSKKDIGY